MSERVGKEVSAITSPKVEGLALRPHEKREASAVFRINPSAIFRGDAGAEYAHPSAFFLQTIRHERCLLSRLLRPRMDCRGGRCAMPTRNEKAPSAELRAVSFLLTESGRGRHLCRKGGLLLIVCAAKLLKIAFRAKLCLTHRYGFNVKETTFKLNDYIINNN